MRKRELHLFHIKRVSGTSQKKKRKESILKISYIHT